MPREIRHIPVLLSEVLDVLRPAPGDTIVDCTVGLGGHSAELLARIQPEGRLIGLDMDPCNIPIAQRRLQEADGTFSLHHMNFAGLPQVLGELGIDRVDGILADLGVASPQIDNPARGFSYRQDGPLDMRMDPHRGRPASDLVNTLGEAELAEAFRELGDEEDANAIARLIVEARGREPILQCGQLVEIVCQARDFTLKRAAGAKLHPAARTFQALRMLVNRELPNLQRLLAVIPQVLRPGRCAAIISFHSGEDRLVKRAFREGLDAGQYEAISPDPLRTTEMEQRGNPRSRSAKLRWARRSAGVLNEPRP